MRIPTTILLIGILLLFACGMEKASSRFETNGSDTVESRLTLFFSGDYMQHIPQVNSARLSDGGFDYRGTLDDLIPFFKNVDFSILNFETTLSEDEYSGFPCFKSPVETMAYLSDIGVKVLAFANNHCCDNGEDGIRLTLQKADSCGLLHMGVYVDTSDYCARNPLWLEKGSIRVALLNYTYSTNGLPIPSGNKVSLIDTAMISRDIRSAYENRATDVIVFYHWGEEYKSVASNRQKKLAEWTHRQGVRLVIGSHPHVIQPIYMDLRNSTIWNITVYSLGNLISNQTQPMCQGGLSFRIELVKRPNAETQYENASYLFHWVAIDRGNGKSRYRVLPAFIADSLLDNTMGYSDFKDFVKQGRRMLEGPNPLEEITAYP